MVPDGYVDWIFHLNEPWQFSLSKNSAPQNFQSHLFTHTKNHNDISLPNNSIHLFGIKFQPWAVSGIWKVDMYQLTNENISFQDFANFKTRELEDKIGNA